MRYSNNPYCYRLTNQNGALEIQLFDATNNSPISNALISISTITYSGQFVEGAEGVVIAEPYTNNDGLIHIHLSPLNELMNNNAFYSAHIQKQGYNDAYIYYIQIYPDINSNYVAYLTPVSDETRRFRYIFQPTTRRVHEH